MVDFPAIAASQHTPHGLEKKWNNKYCSSFSLSVICVYQYLEGKKEGEEGEHCLERQNWKLEVIKLFANIK